MKIIILILTFFSTSILGQVTQEWVARYNGQTNGSDYGSSIAVDGIGNVYVVGSSWGINFDYVTAKYNSSGTQLWIQRYNGPGNGNDYAYSIALDGSGNVYVTGTSAGIGTYDDYATIKYNSSGVQQWVQRFNGSYSLYDWAYALAVDASGNVYVTGSSENNQNNNDYATIKYDTNGNQLWTVRYIGSNNYPQSIAIDNAGNSYITGYSWGGSATKYDYATVKYNSSGIEQWVGRYNNGSGDSVDLAHSVAVDVSGNVYVTGESSNELTARDYATIKYSPNGVQLWVARYNGPYGNASDIAFAIAVDNSGNSYVTGYSYGIGTDYDYATIKYNANGNQIWVSRYNGTGGGFDAASSIAVDSSGSVYVTGESLGPDLRFDYATIKYGTNGNQIWAARYNGPPGGANDYANALAVDGMGNVYVTGRSPGPGTDNDIATIKYSQPIGIKNISTEIPKSFSLSQNYPNPFNPSTKIRFEVAGSSAAQTFLSVYDVLGKEVTTLVNESLKPGTYEVEFNAANFPSGVYFYNIVVGDNTNNGGFTDVKKMVLIK